MDPFWKTSASVQNTRLSQRPAQRHLVREGQGYLVAEIQGRNTALLTPESRITRPTAPFRIQGPKASVIPAGKVARGVTT